MTLLLMSVSHFTTPLNFDMPEFTVIIPELISTVLALMVTFALAFTMIPDASSFTELPLLSIISIESGPSLSVTFWPPGVSTMKRSWPL